MILQTCGEHGVVLLGEAIHVWIYLADFTERRKLLGRYFGSITGEILFYVDRKMGGVWVEFLYWCRWKLICVKIFNLNLDYNILNTLQTSSPTQCHENLSQLRFLSLPPL